MYTVLAQCCEMLPYYNYPKLSYLHHLTNVCTIEIKMECLIEQKRYVDNIF